MNATDANADGDAETVAHEKATTTAFHAVASISHDLLNHVNAVMGLSNSLLCTVMTDEQQGQVRLVGRNGAAMRDIVNNVMTAYRLSNGPVAVDARPFSVLELLDSVTELLSLQANDTRTMFTTLMLPGTREWVVGDTSVIRHILVSLAGNALKFASGGRVVIQALTKPAADDKVELQLSIIDNGIGIATQDQQRIFLPFEQAHADTDKQYGGTGLGLMICTRLAHGLEGTLSVKSEVNKGATFTLTCTVERVSSPSPPTIAARTAALGGERRDRNRTAPERTPSASSASRHVVS